VEEKTNDDEKEDEIAQNESQSKDQVSASSKPSLVALSIRRPPRRDLTSSIASNLATARGKPSSQRRALPVTPEVTAQHVGGKIVAQSTPSPSIPASLHTKSPGTVRSTAASNDTFQTFFNSFESLFSRLSAPLAFAGLPLTNDPSSDPPPPEPEKQTKRHSRHASTRATADPDLSTLFSAPALRAIKEDAGSAFAHESFYVVPTSGGTRSYAGIVRGPSDLEDGAEGSDGEFVDAYETLAGSQSPRSVRGSVLRPGKKNKGPKEARSAGGKTMEELELENTALRQLLDRQSKRLQMWEASAQSQSMALAQSLRLNASARPPMQQTESEREHELQNQIAAERVQREALEHRLEKKERENEKLLGVLGKYKDKWEMLKENARQRERRKEEERRATGS
jgi:hypothetical protein